MNDHQDLPEPRFGERVTFSHELFRTEEERMVDNDFGRKVNQYWGVWKRSPRAESREGLVIGTRTLMNVHRYLVGFDEGWDNDLSTAERFKAYLIAFDMRRKPVFVLPTDIRR